MSPYPWKVRLCTGQALQFLILDANGETVMMAEMYDEQEMLALLEILQRNQEIRCDAVQIQKQLRERT